MSETTDLLPPKEDLQMTCELADLEEIQKKYPQGTFFPQSRCFVVTIDKVTYVIYRGTEINSILDILADLNATKVHPFGKGNGLIHEGFFQRCRFNFGISINAKEDKYDEGSILDLIGKSDAEKIIFTGHSLGGASAELSFLRYITFCENFPSNIASRFKDKSSYIVYAAPISTSIEIRNRFEKYTNQMHSIDQYNDPIVEIVRDAERILRLRESENPTETVKTSKTCFCIPQKKKTSKVCVTIEEEEDDYYDDNNLKEVKMLEIVTREYYNRIRNIDIFTILKNVIQKDEKLIEKNESTIIALYKPTSIAIGIHHIEMKDNSLYSSSDIEKISEIFNEFHTISDLLNHKMSEYKKFINNILNKSE